MNIPYTVVINPRAKRLSFSVTAHDGLRVTMPKHLSTAYIERMIVKYETWITKQLNRHQKQTALLDHQFQFTNGGTTLFAGRPHRLAIVSGAKSVHITDHTITVANKTGSLAVAKHTYSQWLKREARQRFQQQLDIYTQRLNVSYSQLSIRGQKSRWGSCTPQGHISLNWKLLCAPVVVQDYVVIHEAVHLRYHHHKASFWNMVKHHAPEYTSARAWLRTHESAIQFVTAQFS